MSPYFWFLLAPVVLMLLGALVCIIASIITAWTKVHAPSDRS